MKRKPQQKNVKFYIKKNIISFLIGIIIFGGVGVYAAVTFPSNDVTYDNTESGLKSKDVQGAIDELYTECTTTPAGDQIIEDAGLEKDQYECRYFFTGDNPNNYVTFNDETAGWRIVSVECDGTIKIMRYASIGNIAWDSSNSNNWARPASLNTYLNSTYYNSLNATAQSQTTAKDWSIGVVTYDNNDLADQINDENGTKWNGKVALVTTSEYIRSNSDKSNCGSINLNNNNNKCKKTTWMDKTGIYYWWLLSPDSASSTRAFMVYSNGNIGYSYADNAGNLDIGVRPALYLSSEVTLTGSGTQSDPYVVN